MMVEQVSGEGAWTLTDLLGRSMGRILEVTEGQFRIAPEGQAVKTMVGLKFGPHATLDDALTAIEIHTRGVCRRVGETRP